MKSVSKPLVFSLALTFSGLFLLTGCAWWPFSNNKSSSSSVPSDVLLSIDGKPALTVSEYEEQLEMARKANPQIDMLLQMMPNAEKEYIFRGMMTAKLMKAWAQKQGIDKTDDFKKQQKQLHEAMDLNLYMKHFDDAHPVQVSDSDLSKFYEEKKDLIPALTLSPGGVEISFVRFEGKNAADAFLAKSKDVRKATSFKTLADEGKHQVNSAVINAKSPFSETLKNAVLDVKKFPSVQMIKEGDHAYWVVLATGKSDTKYRDLKTPEINQGLRKMLADERKEKQLEAEMNALKGQLNVVEHGKYFEDKEQQKRAALQDAGQDDQSENASMVPVKA
jgi:hypothetical protein